MNYNDDRLREIVNKFIGINNLNNLNTIDFELMFNNLMDSSNDKYEENINDLKYWIDKALERGNKDMFNRLSKLYNRVMIEK
jgi:hypothetical protein